MGEDIGEEDSGSFRVKLVSKFIFGEGSLIEVGDYTMLPLTPCHHPNNLSNP